MWMAMIHAGRTVLQTALLVVVGGLSACGTGAERKDHELDPRLAGPCSRLIVDWSVDVDVLEDFIAVELTPRDEDGDGMGELQLGIQQCGRGSLFGSKSRTLSFAYLMVPVSADGIPLVITSIPPHGWYSLPFVIADSTSAPIFSDLGYEVLQAEITFAASLSSDETSIQSRLDFDGGAISLLADTSAKPVPYDASIALLDVGPDFDSALFGQEAAERYVSESVMVQTEGSTPLSGLDLSESSPTAVIDAGWTSDRFFWRVPRNRR